MPRSVWQRLPVGGTFDVSGRFRYEAAPADLSARPLYWRGIAGIEPESVAAFERLAPADGGIVVDVGAHTGLYTLLACSVGANVVALEPVERVQHQLQRNVALNGWTNRCRLLLAAADAHTGTVEVVEPRSSLPSSAHLAGAAYRSDEGERVTVEAVRLDDVLADDDVRLVKIDVEGAEDRVLAGMTETLRRCRPTIFVECLPEGPYRAVQAILDAYGYRFAHLRAEGPVPMASIVPDRTRVFRNFLCQTLADQYAR
jgi:FkbM family methyltransferase